MWNDRENKEEVHIVDEINDDSEDEGIEDYTEGGYHPIHIGYAFPLDSC